MKNKKFGSVNSDQIEDESTTRSEVSVNTDMKVFNGACNDKDMIKKLTLSSACKQNQTIQSIPKSSHRNNNNIQEKFSTNISKDSDMSKYKKKKNSDLKIKNVLKKISNADNGDPICSNAKDSEPLSFRNKLNLNEKNDYNNKNINNKTSEEPETVREKDIEKRSQHSEQKSIHSKKSNSSQKIQHAYGDPIEKSLIPINQTKPHPKEKPLEKEKDLANIKHIMSSSSGDENDAQKEPHENMEKNIFWKLKDAAVGEEENILGIGNSQVCEGGEDNEASTNMTRLRGNVHTTTQSQVSFTLSKIDKGVALLVSHDDVIFTLPAFFLPRGMHIGNMYKMILEETIKGVDKMKTIKMMQKKFMKSNLSKK